MDRKSISGTLHTYNGTQICWGSLKRNITALSTCQAEYIAATSAAQQTTWIRRLLQDVHMLRNSPTPLMIDNQSAIHVANSAGPTKRQKFKDLRHHYLTHQAAKGTIAIAHVPTDEQIADILIKPLRRQAYTRLLPKPQLTKHRTADGKTAVPSTGGVS